MALPVSCEHYGRMPGNRALQVARVAGLLLVSVAIVIPVSWLAYYMPGIIAEHLWPGPLCPPGPSFYGECELHETKQQSIVVPLKIVFAASCLPLFLWIIKVLRSSWRLVRAEPADFDWEEPDP